MQQLFRRKDEGKVRNSVGNQAGGDWPSRGSALDSANSEKEHCLMIPFLLHSIHPQQHCAGRVSLLFTLSARER